MVTTLVFTASTLVLIGYLSQGRVLRNSFPFHYFLMLIPFLMVTTLTFTASTLVQIAH
jgi:hypothetical protein